MTSTGINIGLEGQTRNSSKVLKPPGGGSSDIFGADNAEPRRQRNVNQLQSSTVFSNMMETVTPAKSKLNGDSHCRLFGADSAPLLPPAPHPNTHLGHSFFDEAAAQEPTMEPTMEPTVEPTVETETLVADELAGEHRATISKHSSGFNSNKARDSRRNPINHVGMTAADCSQTYNNRGRAARKIDGNPVTGEGYAIANGVKEMAAAVPTPTAAPKVAMPLAAAAVPPQSAASKGRVPPGGFSSGLW